MQRVQKRQRICLLLLTANNAKTWSNRVKKRKKRGSAVFSVHLFAVTNSEQPQTTALGKNYLSWELFCKVGYCVNFLYFFDYLFQIFFLCDISSLKLVNFSWKKMATFSREAVMMYPAMPIYQVLVALYHVSLPLLLASRGIFKCCSWFGRSTLSAKLISLIWIRAIQQNVLQDIMS